MKLLKEFTLIVKFCVISSYKIKFSHKTYPCFFLKRVALFVPFVPSIDFVQASKIRKKLSCSWLWALSVPDLTSQSTWHVRLDFNAMKISFVVSNQKWIHASSDSTTKKTLLSNLGNFGFYETSTFSTKKENSFWG